VMGHSDTWSLTKIKDFLRRGKTQVDYEKDVRIVKLFRSREVKQSYLTSIGTTVIALLHSLWVVTKLRPDIVRTHTMLIYLDRHKRPWYSRTNLLYPLLPL
jgi:hypothetical protein